MPNEQDRAEYARQSLEAPARAIQSEAAARVARQVAIDMRGHDIHNPARPRDLTPQERARTEAEAKAKAEAKAREEAELDRTVPGWRDKLRIFIG
jgi:hypothetical protein